MKIKGSNLSFPHSLGHVRTSMSTPSLRSSISVLDTTLRDGLQGEDVSLSVNDKLNIVKLLDGFGVNFIEAGNPFSNPKDALFFEEAQRLKLANAKLTAFGSTVRKHTKPEDDAGLNALLAANTEIVTIFGKSSILHVNEVLKVTPEENLRMIRATVEYLVSKNRKVIFDAEHFYDGYAMDKDYAEKSLAAAAEAGAFVLCLCDTNGGTLPTTIFDITKKIVGLYPNAQIGVHTHNDSGCAVANTLAAVNAGAAHIQGTFTGFGERCGNAELCSVLPNLVLKMKKECDADLSKLTVTATAICECANLKLENNKPYIGKSAFTHKGGMHIDGVLKHTASFEHVDPETVGNKRRFLVSEVAGRGVVFEKLKTYFPDIEKTSVELDAIVAKLKEMESAGYQFEAADASFELMAAGVLNRRKKFFNLKFYKTMAEFPVAEGELSASATIKVEVDGKTEMTAAAGDGPVNALDLALRKALTVFYPAISDMHLTDYKVRVIDQNMNTAAKVRVLIESTDKEKVWTTIGVSENIIEASLTALIDSIEYKLLH